ncbi:MAG: hypothetical protein ACREEX_13845, partial [Caulobacteraceae bacterium]
FHVADLACVIDAPKRARAAMHRHGELSRHDLSPPLCPAWALRIASDGIKASARETFDAGDDEH